MNRRSGDCLVLQCAEGLTRLAARPLPDTERGDWAAMWAAEAYAIHHDQDLGHLRRTLAALWFALSLVLHRRALRPTAPAPQEEWEWADVGWSLLLAFTGLAPVLLGVTAGLLSGSVGWGILIFVWAMSHCVPLCLRLSDVHPGGPAPSPPSVLIVGDYSWMAR
jgi:hypothetical protein